MVKKWLHKRHYSKNTSKHEKIICQLPLIITVNKKTPTLSLIIENSCEISQDGTNKGHVERKFEMLRLMRL